MTKKKFYDINGREVQVNDVLYYREEDGEDEAGAGVGNASSYVNQGYIKIVEYNGKRYSINCDKNGWYKVEQIDFKELLSIEEDINARKDFAEMIIINR